MHASLCSLHPSGIPLSVWCQTESGIWKNSNVACVVWLGDCWLDTWPMQLLARAVLLQCLEDDGGSRQLAACSWATEWSRQLAVNLSLSVATLFLPWAGQFVCLVWPHSIVPVMTCVCSFDPCRADVTSFFSTRWTAIHHQLTLLDADPLAASVTINSLNSFVCQEKAWELNVTMSGCCISKHTHSAT